ncbi:polyprenyldihydroxybenzoate methyltransferase / 3-demethylubiquinol 3-O-methyltransferase, partial [Paragonimus westermani]
MVERWVQCGAFCGHASQTQPLAAIGADVMGIDQVAESIDVAQQHVKQAAYRWSELGSKPPCYRLVSLGSLASESPAQFDAVVMSEVLEHVTDWEGMIHQASLCLKPNGMLFITTLNRTRASFLFGILGAEYLTRTLPRGTHKWAKFIEPTRLQAAAVKCKFCYC